MSNSYSIWWVNQNNGILSGQLYKTSAVEYNHSSHSDILGTKDRRQKEMLGDDMFLMLIGQTNIYLIMLKTTIFAITPQEE